MKPGMTCYWQTRRNRDSTTFDERVDLDLWGPYALEVDDLNTARGLIVSYAEYCIHIVPVGEPES